MMWHTIFKKVMEFYQIWSGNPRKGHGICYPKSCSPCKLSFTKCSNTNICKYYSLSSIEFDDAAFYICLLEFIRRHSAILPNNENIFKLGNLLNKIYFWIKGRKITSSKSCIYFYLLKAICSTGMVWTTKLLRTM